MNNKIKEFLEKDSAFILLLGMASAGVIGGTSLFLESGTGLFNEIYIGEMFNVGQETGDYTAPAAFAVGFLIARILEGPLVGILDIGGSLMTGIGVGIPALLLSAGLGFLVTNFGMSLLTGFAVGVVIGAVMILIRKLAPDLSLATATSIMMGAGNQSGEALGPLVLLSAVSYSIPVGVGAIIGSVIFYKYKRPMVGGAILGAIIVGGIYLLLGGTLPEVAQ
ncbi:DUF4310 family protein [Atopococcus tabaci]|uniref:DUF4310 family protein n=1 Tax=Atopococcus tabaci TaxID=269774 RepID=UPI000427C5AA|nr:DUF4310 family protein [Atopococcus tabaci]